VSVHLTLTRSTSRSCILKFTYTVGVGKQFSGEKHFRQFIQFIMRGKAMFEFLSVSSGSGTCFFLFFRYFMLNGATSSKGYSLTYSFLRFPTAVSCRVFVVIFIHHNNGSSKKREKNNIEYELNINLNYHISSHIMTKLNRQHLTTFFSGCTSK